MQSHSNETNTVVAFFDSHSDAQNAIDRLDEAGVAADRITIVEGNKPAAGSADAGGSDKGLFASLKGMFIPDDDQQTYAEGLRRGGHLVSVRTGPDEYQSVVDILDAEGSIDIDERTASWRAEGWAGGGAIEVAEEQMRIGKRDVSHGRVRIRSYTVADEVSEDVALRHETVRVERRPADRPVKEADAAFQDRKIEIEEVAEEPVVSKEARVVEEVEVSKDVRTETETVHDTVRHTEMEIDDERKR